MFFRVSRFYLLQFSFDDANQTVTFEDYPHLDVPDSAYAWTMQNSGNYLLIYTGSTMIKYDFKEGSQFIYELAEDLRDDVVRVQSFSSVVLTS